MVTIEYHDGKPVGVKTIVVSIQRKERVELEQLRSEIFSNIPFTITQAA